MNDSRYPWFILVPEKQNLTEIFHLNKEERIILMEESSYLAESLARLYRADKMNIAAIGNLVSQLHVHHIVRYTTDAAWPAPIWGKGAPIPYLEERIAAITDQIRDRLSGYLKEI
jgi:diadenosine tetraphosphate (Ap4A) HIT family hydrolase